MPYGLKDDAIAAIHGVLARHAAIERVVLYGSRAKGNYKAGSDIDLTIIEHGLAQEDLARIEAQLDDLLLPYTIDLSLYQQLGLPALIEHIRRVGIVFYTAEALRTAGTAYGG